MKPNLEHLLDVIALPWFTVSGLFLKSVGNQRVLKAFLITFKVNLLVNNTNWTVLLTRIHAVISKILILLF